MNRLLVFHYHDPVGNEVRMAPSAYYIDADYEKVAVRIYAETAPTSDAKVDVFDDGVSIFNNHKSEQVSLTTGLVTVVNDSTSIILPANTNSDDMADDFNSSIIEEGSWVYCNLVSAGGGKNFTVQLELHPLSEDEELAE